MIKIGEAESWRDDYDITFEEDDRQTLIQTANGAIVEDKGYHLKGSKITLQGIIFRRAEFELVHDYYVNRTKVTFVDQAGISYTNMGVHITSYGYEEKFPNVIHADIELWFA